MHCVYLRTYAFMVFKKTKYQPTYIATSAANVPDLNEALSSTILPETILLWYSMCSLI